VVVVTSDNPRTEDPERIIDEVKRGLPPTNNRSKSRGQRPTPGQPECLAIVDRRAAIERAVEIALPGDLILVAGKGHEKYQVIGERVLPFDDVAVAREALQKRRSRTRVG
jgi:UDP-N-acetylmuramoyl-L-alanyl-D-glutamate--2,6-diaminopimelate ligase